MDSKIENRVLQLGSLNDELKRVVGLINQKNEELLSLEKKIAELNDSVAILYSETEKQEEKIKTNDLKLNSLASDKIVRQKEIGVLDDSLSELGAREVVLGSSIRTNKKAIQNSQIKLAEIGKDLDTAKNKKRELSSLERKIKVKNAELDDYRIVLRDTKDEVKDIQTGISIEKAEHRKWLKTTKAKAQDEVAKAIKRIDDLDSYKKDLKIVEKRLRKIWEQTTTLPFPKLDA